jgi:hypothetical protein
MAHAMTAAPRAAALKSNWAVRIPRCSSLGIALPGVFAASFGLFMSDPFIRLKSPFIRLKYG